MSAKASVLDPERLDERVARSNTCTIGQQQQP